jgi:hypothetical protein
MRKLIVTRCTWFARIVFLMTGMALLGQTGMASEAVSLNTPKPSTGGCGSTLIIPPILWHIYKEEAFLEYTEGTYNNIYNNIATLKYLGNVKPQDYLEVSLPTEYRSFRETACDVQKFYNHRMGDILREKELLAEAVSLGVLAEAQYVVCTFYVGNALLGKADTEANWAPDGSFVIKTSFYTEAYVVVLDTNKNAVVFHDDFKESDTVKLTG